MKRCDKKLIAVCIKDISNRLYFDNRTHANNLGWDKNKICSSLKDPKQSHRGYIWFYLEQFSESELDYRLKLYNNTTRKLVEPLYRNCAKCKVEKSWLNFYTKKGKKDTWCKECVIFGASFWAKNNRQRINKSANKRAQNSLYRLRLNMGNRSGQAVKKYAENKKGSILKYLGCTLKELGKYLENQFRHGMNWENYGQWELDHIVPLSYARTEDELYKLCHYTNLQPLWANENRSKSSKLDWSLNCA